MGRARSLFGSTNFWKVLRRVRRGWGEGRCCEGGRVLYRLSWVVGFSNDENCLGFKRLITGMIEEENENEGKE